MLQTRLLTRRLLLPLSATATRLAFPFSLSPSQQPPSKLEQFIVHINQIHEETSFAKAAEMLAELQSDQDIYRQQLKKTQEEIALFEVSQPAVVNAVRKGQQLQHELAEARQECKDVEVRCQKELQNIRVFGVARIAKEVIEVADHLAKAIHACKQHHHQNHLSQLKNLQILSQNLRTFLSKHEIEEIDPLGTSFNPNQHHAVSFTTTPDPSKANTVAEVNRSCWKLRERVLRQASVVIYK